ncbi:hypothetical protein [Erythrobacter donghaensis]|uniref:hypothetical protein n=1 Tax=Erythrobacter donghaensis TaxID=267135 RepID=UPI0012D9F7D3|nr:hypothetical protein [Erythrobacter donghaensis]
MATSLHGPRLSPGTDKAWVRLGSLCLPLRTLARRSSGKLERAEAKKRYLAGEIVPIDLAA